MGRSESGFGRRRRSEHVHPLSKATREADIIIVARSSTECTRSTNRATNPSSRVRSNPPTPTDRVTTASRTCVTKPRRHSRIRRRDATCSPKATRRSPRTAGVASVSVGFLRRRTTELPGITSPCRRCTTTTTCRSASCPTTHRCTTATSIATTISTRSRCTSAKTPSRDSKSACNRSGETRRCHQADIAT